MALAVLSLVTVGAVQALLIGNRQAAGARAYTCARAVVQRNVDLALSLTFNTDTKPAILAQTDESGVTYDDDGDGDNLVRILVQEDGTTRQIMGTLTRIVRPAPDNGGADIRRITFRLAYEFLGKNYTCSMTTERAIDD